VSFSPYVSHSLCGISSNIMIQSSLTLVLVEGAKAVAEATKREARASFMLFICE
jgi:hypothetical protein